MKVSIVIVIICSFCFSCEKEDGATNKAFRPLSLLVNALARKDSATIKELSTRNAYNEILQKGFDECEEHLGYFQNVSARVDSSAHHLSIEMCPKFDNVTIEHCPYISFSKEFPNGWKLCDIGGRK